MGTQCYLPAGRGDIPALTQAEAGTRLSDPKGMQGLNLALSCATTLLNSLTYLLTTSPFERSYALCISVTSSRF